MTQGIDLDDWDGYISGVGYGYYRKRTWSGANRLPGASYDAENQYTATIHEMQLDQVATIVRGTLTNGCMQSYCPALPSLISYPINRCSKKVWEKLTQSNFNLGVFGGEFKETVDFISHTVRYLARILLAARQGQWSKVNRLLTRRRSAGAVYANTHLSVTYALMPLLQDIKNAYEYLTSNYEVVSRVKVTAVDKTEQKLTKVSVQWDHKKSQIAQIRGVVTAPISEADRLGLTDPLSVAWELTRLSFVYDWLIPVGTFLAAANARRRTEGIFMLTTCQKESLLNPVEIPGLWWPLNGIPADQSRHFVLTNRDAYVDLPWAMPSIENPLGDHYARYISSVALLRQVFH